MQMLFYTFDPPHGRCLLLAHQLHQVTSMSASDCVRSAEQLFAGHHPRENPLFLEICEPNSVEDLEAICSGMGVVIEKTEDSGKAEKLGVTTVANPLRDEHSSLA